MFRASFLSSDALRAAGVPRSIFVTWEKRGLFQFGDGDVRADGTGYRHILSFESTFILATVQVLVELGVTASKAFEMAERVRHAGTDLVVTHGEGKIWVDVCKVRARLRKRLGVTAAIHAASANGSRANGALR